MAFTNTALNKATDAITNGAYLSLHSADPGTTGASLVGTRQLASFPAASGSGDATVTNKNFTGLAANQAVTYVGLWDAASAGNFLGGFALTGDQSANAAGAYTVTSLTVNATAT